MYSANIEQGFQIAEFERNERIEQRNQDRLIAEANAEGRQIATRYRATIAVASKAIAARMHGPRQPRRRAAVG